MRTLIALAALLLLADAALARTPGRRTQLYDDPGARGDITVPYLTNGFSAFGVANGVGPAIYKDPMLSQPPQMRPVFNLPFYGGRLDPSGQIIGAAPAGYPGRR